MPGSFSTRAHKHSSDPRRTFESWSKAWRERSLKEEYYPYLYLDATYLKVNWGGSVVGMMLLGFTGVDEEGLREVLAVAGGEKGAAYSSLLRCLLDRDLMGVRLIVSDDHEGI